MMENIQETKDMSSNSAVEDTESALPEDSESAKGRGQKRPLEEDAIPASKPDATTATGELPPGVAISWKNSKDLLVTFDPALSSTGEIKVCMVGRAKLRCLAGQVEVLGHTLTQNSEETTVTSPFWSSWITIQTTTATQLEFMSLRGEPSFRLEPPSRATVIPPNWNEAVDQICSDARDSSIPVRDSLEENSTYTHEKKQIVMICGAKGVGKSTLLRYMTNRLLQQVPAVAILDADVGQPELAPPGILKLSLQRQPLLQPPYWNLCSKASSVQLDQIDAVYFGSVTTRIDPTRYIEAIEKLLQAYYSFLTTQSIHVPLIINMDGWIKGMGFQILTTLLSNVGPSHVCQLLGDSKGKTFDLSDVINSELQDEEEQVLPQQEVGNNTALFILDACTKHVTPCTIPAATLRTLRLATYFGQDLVELWDTLDFLPARNLQTGWSGDDECILANSLARERPYFVPMECVDYFNHTTMGDELVGEAQILRALNGSIVGLCTSGDGCLGLGIVRSIDWRKRLFYILTPVPENELQGVTKLVGGSIPLPLPFVYRGVYAESFPYLKTVSSAEANGQILGVEPMKSRNNIGRRGNQNGGGGGGK